MNGIRTHNHLVCKETLNHLAKLARWLSCVLSTYLYNAFDYIIIMSCTRFRENLHSIVCLKIKKLLAQSRCHIWSRSDSNMIWIHNHLVHKQTVNYLCKLANLAIWLSVRSPGVLVKIKIYISNIDSVKMWGKLS